MTFDPKGTTPGTLPEEPVQKTVAISCRNNCGGQVAFELHTTPQNPDYGAPSQRLYCCKKCNHTWGVSVGSNFNF